MPFDSEIARRFIAAVPAGRWTTYGDVAARGGDQLPMAAFRVGQWLAGSEGSIDNYWRVVDVDGRVPEEFAPGGLGPRTADEARDWLTLTPRAAGGLCVTVQLPAAPPNGGR
jgi:hypothetical protein